MYDCRRRANSAVKQETVEASRSESSKASDETPAQEEPTIQSKKSKKKKGKSKKGKKSLGSRATSLEVPKPAEAPQPRSLPRPEMPYVVDSPASQDFLHKKTVEPVTDFTSGVGAYYASKERHKEHLRRALRFQAHATTDPEAHTDLGDKSRFHESLDPYQGFEETARRLGYNPPSSSQRFRSSNPHISRIDHLFADQEAEEQRNRSHRGNETGIIVPVEEYVPAGRRSGFQLPDTHGSSTPDSQSSGMEHDRSSKPTQAAPVNTIQELQLMIDLEGDIEYILSDDFVALDGDSSSQRPKELTFDRLRQIQEGELLLAQSLRRNDKPDRTAAEWVRGAIDYIARAAQTSSRAGKRLQGHHRQEITSHKTNNPRSGQAKEGAATDQTCDQTKGRPNSSDSSKLFVLPSSSTQ